MGERTDLNIDHQTWHRGGRYAAIGEDGSEIGKLVYMESLTAPNTLAIVSVEVPEQYRRTGIMAGLWRRMHNDFPDWFIHSGVRNDDSEAFYQFLKREHTELHDHHHDPNAVDGIINLTANINPRARPT